MDVIEQTKVLKSQKSKGTLKRDETFAALYSIFPLLTFLEREISCDLTSIVSPLKAQQRV